MNNLETGDLFVQIADLNNDGTLDILSSNLAFGGGSLSALIGAGNGTFASGALIAILGHCVLGNAKIFTRNEKAHVNTLA